MRPRNAEEARQGRLKESFELAEYLRTDGAELVRRPAGGLSVLAAGQRTRQGVAVCWNRDSCRPPAETGPDPRNTAAGDLPAEAGRSPPPHTTNPMDTGVAHTPARFQYCRFFLTG